MLWVRVIASIVSLVNGGWGLLAWLYSAKIFGVNLSAGSGGIWIPIVAVLLVLDSLVSFAGFRTAFYASVALSVLLLLDILLFGAVIASAAFAASALLALATVILGIIAARMRPRVSEENHPLNLPVFG